MLTVDGQGGATAGVLQPLRHGAQVGQVPRGQVQLDNVVANVVQLVANLDQTVLGEHALTQDVGDVPAVVLEQKVISVVLEPDAN